MLDKKQVEFFIDRIENAHVGSFSGAVTQLFDYINKNVSSNPVFQKLEQDYEHGRWSHWNKPGWQIPGDLEEAKSLSYTLYRTIVDLEENGIQLPRNILHIKSGNTDEYIQLFNKTFIPYFTLALEDILHSENQEDSDQKEFDENDIIFIIHGHDNEMKRDVQLFLKRAGLKDVVLHECPDKGRTIIEKLIDEGSSACYVIALLSPDDKLEDGKLRARQNVILEIGYFLGKLGKARVRMLRKGNVEIPSDLQGVLYTDYDTGGSWKIKLIKEMKSGDINLNSNEVLKKF